MPFDTVEISGRPTRLIPGDTSAATFMAGVYRWMFAGLLMTAGVAYYVASDPALVMQLMHWAIPLIILQLALVFGLSFFASRLSGAVAGVLFLAYSGLTGLTFSSLFLIYQLGSLAQAFGLTAGVFGALSFYGTVTKRDLGPWRTFLMMGLFGVLGAGIIVMFTRSSALSFVMSCASVVVFAGLTAYDTQKLRQFHAAAGAEGGGSQTIVGALMLYLDFVNIFLSLLRLFGKRR